MFSYETMTLWWCLQTDHIHSKKKKKENVSMYISSAAVSNGRAVKPVWHISQIENNAVITVKWIHSFECQKLQVWPIINTADMVSFSLFLAYTNTHTRAYTLFLSCPSSDIWYSVVYWLGFVVWQDNRSMVPTEGNWWMVVPWAVQSVLLSTSLMCWFH